MNNILYYNSGNITRNWQKCWLQNCVKRNLNFLVFIQINILQESANINEANVSRPRKIGSRTFSLTEENMFM